MQFGTNYICWGHLGTRIGIHLVSGLKLYVVTWTFLLAKCNQLRSPEFEDNLAPGTLPVILELLQHCAVTAGNPISQTSEVSLKFYQQASHSKIHCSNNCISPSSAVWLSFEKLWSFVLNQCTLINKIQTKCSNFLSTVLIII